VGELQGLLLDMDGTLCDTEPSWMASEHALAARYEAEWTAADGLSLVGRNLLESGAYIKQRMGLAATPAEIVDELLDLVTAEVARSGVAWCPGATELVEACNQAGVPVALVTMSYRRFTESLVALMPRGRFDVIVTGDEVTRGKPDPEPYLTAARLLGVEASGCVAIEDSPTGVASARAAGCRVLVVPNHVPVPITHDLRERRTLSGLTVERLASLLTER
jgi:HAD superfamily hydrolase (TIGR01509 family)